MDDVTLNPTNQYFKKQLYLDLHHVYHLPDTKKKDMFINTCCNIFLKKNKDAHVYDAKIWIGKKLPVPVFV